jgi:hypothetical protein
MPSARKPIGLHEPHINEGICCIFATQSLDRLTSKWLQLVGVSALLALVAAAPPGRQSLGIFSSWGAFRDNAPPRCYAIATPEGGRRGSKWQSFAAVGIWPTRRLSGQVHFRLREPRAKGSPIRLIFGDASFPLVAGGVDAWAPDPRGDAAIIAAMRGGTSMRVAWVSVDGRDRSDGYLLKGIASAIDAAALGCARRK